MLSPFATLTSRPMPPLVSNSAGRDQRFLHQLVPVIGRLGSQPRGPHTSIALPPEVIFEICTSFELHGPLWPYGLSSGSARATAGAKMASGARAAMIAFLMEGLPSLGVWTEELVRAANDESRLGDT